jgi:D-alanyl-D-alanine carboxypeptidase
MAVRSLLWKAVVVVGICVGIAVPAHFYISDRLGVLRVLYPFEAQLAEWSTACSPRAPSWMTTSMKALIWERDSTGNQLIYVSPDGGQHSCTSGWIATPFISPRISDSSRFRYASTTKLFTADAVLALIADGRLALNSRLVELLPELADPVDVRYQLITLEHLIRHRAGFDRFKSPDPMFKWHEQSLCPARLPELSKLVLDYTPGEKTVYSNLGYCLLGAIVERVTQVEFRTYLEQQYQLAGAGIRFVNGPYLDDEVQYDMRNENFYDLTYWRYFDFQSLSSSAGLSGSARALADKVDTLRQRKPVSVFEYQFDELCPPAKRDGEPCYGFAPQIDAREGQALVLYRHSGSLVTAASEVIVDNQGGVLVWLAKGRPLELAHARRFDHDHFYGQLLKWYGLE